MHYLHHPESCCVWKTVELEWHDFEDGCTVEIDEDTYKRLHIMYNRKTIIITHTDLDGVSSGYLAGRAFDTDIIMSANYSEVTNVLASAYYSYGQNNDLVITDLNILPEDLQFALKHFNNVTIFDHHPSSKDFIPLEKINNRFKIFFSNEICATTLVATYMMNQGHEFTEVEKKYFRLVNIYDMWKSDHKEFIYGRIANDIFWMYGWNGYLKKLQENVFDIPKGLNHEELAYAKNAFDEIAKAGKTAEWYNTDCGSTIVILEDHQKPAINLISDYIDSQTGIYYIFYYGGRFRCSVRVRGSHNDDYDIGGELREFISTSELLDTCGGHKNAAGSAFKKSVKLGEALTEIERFDTFLFSRLEVA